MNEFDQFVKQDLKVKNYARYTDDFITVSENLAYLKGILPPIQQFLAEKLSLSLHPKKVGIHKLHRGIGFLGYTLFPHYRLVLRKTRRRIFKKFVGRLAEFRAGRLSKNSIESSLSSYLGVFSHADAFEISQELLNRYWLE